MKNQKKFVFIVSLYLTLLYISNLMATKITTFWGMILPAAVIAYPLCFMTGDVLTEVWGYKNAKYIIWLGFGLQALLSAWTAFGIFLPYPDFYDGQEAYARIFGAVPRVVIGSFAGYLAGELSNSFTLDWIKKFTGKRFMFIRTIGSSIVGQALDTLLFFPIAFYGTVPNDALIEMMITQYLFKLLIEALAGTPLAYGLVRWARKED